MSERPPLSADQIAEMAIDYIHREFAPESPERIAADENVLTSGVIDSVGIVRLTAHLSETLGVEIPPADLVPANFRSPRAMGEYLEGRAGTLERRR